MALETIKTTRLVGNLKVEDTLVKQYVVDINEQGISNISESIYDANLYSQNRAEMRRQEEAFRNKRYEIEDAILAELTKEDAAKQAQKVKKYMWKPEFLSMILSAAVSLLTLFTFFQSRMTSTEKRLTILEEKNRQNDKESEETKSRLDNHDLQMKVLIQMTEQIKNLSEKVDKIDNKLEELS